MKALYTTALALALTALPGAALAQEWTGPVNAKNQFAHLQTLFTPASSQCISDDEFSDAERAEGCVEAIAELQAKREAKGAMGVTEKANYDFFEALMNIAMGHAYAQVDGEMTPRACKAAERSWSLAHAQMAVPKDAVDPEFYSVIQNPPADIDRVLGECRTKHGKPADGAPLPAELKKKK